MVGSNLITERAVAQGAQVEKYRVVGAMVVIAANALEGSILTVPRIIVSTAPVVSSAMVGGGTVVGTMGIAIIVQGAGTNPILSLQLASNVLLASTRTRVPRTAAKLAAVPTSGRIRRERRAAKHVRQA